MYGSQLWDCAKKSNTDIIRTSQNNFLRMITNAYRYVTNKDIHNDLEIEWVSEVIRENAKATQSHQCRSLSTVRHNKRIKETKTSQTI